MNIAKATGRSYIVAIAALALLGGSVSPAFAAARDPDAGAPTPTPQSTPVQKVQRICIEGEITGSRIPRRICKTRDQWIKEDGIDPLKPQDR